MNWMKAYMDVPEVDLLDIESKNKHLICCFLFHPKSVDVAFQFLQVGLKEVCFKIVSASMEQNQREERDPNLKVSERAMHKASGIGPSR